MTDPRLMIWFSGGPRDRDGMIFEPDHTLMAEGHGVILEEPPVRVNGRHQAPEGWTPRRGHYVRVGNLALWWGWEGSRPRLRAGQG